MRKSTYRTLKLVLDVVLVRAVFILLLGALTGRQAEAASGPFDWTGSVAITAPGCRTLTVTLPGPPAAAVALQVASTGSDATTVGTVDFNGQGTRAWNPPGVYSVPAPWLQSGANSVKVCLTAGAGFTITGLSGTDTPSSGSSGGAVGGGTVTLPVPVAVLPTIVDWMNRGILPPNALTAAWHKAYLSNGVIRLACAADDQRHTYYYRAMTAPNAEVVWKGGPAVLAHPDCAAASVACFGDTRATCY